MSFLATAISKMETTKSQMQQVGVERIHLDPTNDSLYPRFDPENNADDRDLIESIREVGLLQPLCVRRHGQLPDEHIVISGHRRLQACRAAGIKTVECLILSADTAEDQITLKMDLVLSNRMRDRSNPAIQAKEVAFLENHMRDLKKINPARFKGFTIRSLVAAELGVSERTVASAEKINHNLDQETYAAFISGKISQKVALEKADKTLSDAGRKTVAALSTPVSAKKTNRQGKIATTSDKLITRRLSKKLEDSVARMEDNPQLWPDKTIQDCVLRLEKRITALLCGLV